MSWRNPRRILLVCAGLDLAGLVGLLALISLFKPLPVFPQLGWLVFTALAYLGLGWLFGSYTVLRWRRLPLNAVLQRVLITGVVTLVVVALARLLLNPAETVWLVHRSTQIAWLLPLMVWSLLMRGLLRRGCCCRRRLRWHWWALSQSWSWCWRPGGARRCGSRCGASAWSRR